jgi:hypothetical protein
MSYVYAIWDIEKRAFLSSPLYHPLSYCKKILVFSHRKDCERAILSRKEKNKLRSKRINVI